MTPPETPTLGFNLVGRVRRTVDSAAARAGVVLHEVEEMDDLREVSDLFARVWGRSDEGVPMHSEALRSMAHAGGLVDVARDRVTGELVGAAVLGRDVPGAVYGYLAAVAPGVADRGIGRALKQHQRLWALEHDVAVMRWTFDPLVGRNARFNISRLGATVADYLPAFYGTMSDALNGTDRGDRLVAEWELRSPRALAAAEGTLPEPAADPVGDAPAGADVRTGPDGIPALVTTPGQRWLRVPEDIVALRRTDPAQARAWRSTTADWFQDAFAAGLVARGVSRTGWYHLTEDA
ncbi:GNAT family N-acetyltransferase [Ornithinimicrobium tianjinense]|uniref:BioF2-like acetyltransferase domain-containing protein n=1 Tax=Ornithinimicrobium tianjinense TaxID=1195761 RepID=A0A917BHN1_9MICO|nr:GNAT family N-acetyltransferase [Ornithinimicrobium tianjinense]GGF39585.1 hypothetical protein GCM10011366_04000 [Ornithinimicrobium tianjinense]